MAISWSAPAYGSTIYWVDDPTFSWTASVPVGTEGNTVVMLLLDGQYMGSHQLRNKERSVKASALTGLSGILQNATGKTYLFQLQLQWTLNGVDYTDFSDRLFIVHGSYPAPAKPVFTSPSAGQQVYTNANLNVSWQYKGTDLPQGGYEIQVYLPGASAWSALASGNGTGTSYTIPANKYSWSDFTRAKSYSLRVRTKDSFGTWSAYSDSVLFQYQETYPDKIIPTAPANGATHYRVDTLTFKYNYTGYGGYALQKMELQYYYSGETAWSRSHTVTTSATEFTLAAYFFAEGTVTWRLRAVNVAGEAGPWSDARTLVSAMPPAPGKPYLTSPSPGQSVYVNSALNLSWQYAGNGTNQGGYEVQYRLQGAAGFTTYATASTAATSYSIPGNTFGWAELTRGKNYEWRVRNKNSYGTWGPYSDTVLMTYNETYPDAPVPTSPANNATTYPKAELTLAFPYTAHGGYALKTIELEWYYPGETAWSRKKSFTTSTASVVIPANTFSVGTATWRIRVTNIANEVSAYSAGRTLNVISSAPVAPTLKSPGNGDTLYDNAAVTYGWTYNDNVGLSQSAFRLEWRKSGTASWTVIEQNTGAAQYTLNHGTTIEGVIEWRVMVKNTLSEWSAYSATGAYVYLSSRPAAAIVSPLGGFVDPASEQVFEWTYASPVDMLQAAFELNWKLSQSGSWQIITGGAQLQAAIPAGTFPEGTIYWRVRVQDAGGKWSAWTEEREISTVDAQPLAPTLLAPIGIYLSIAEVIPFRWRHNSPVGTPQNGAELSYRLDGGDWVVAAISGAAQAYDLAAFTLSPGTVSWRVRTLSRNGLWGPLSETATFGLTGAPEKPTITQMIPRGSRPIWRWVANGQIVYEVRITDEHGNEVVSLEELAVDASGEYTPGVFLPEGNYVFSVRAKNQFDYWSEWESMNFTIATVKPGAPAIAATASRYAVVIDIDGIDWGEVSRVLLYRDGVPVARPGSGRYLDYTVCGDAAYFVRAVYDGEVYADSNVAHVQLLPPSAVFAPAGDPAAVWIGAINYAAPPTRSGSGEKESSALQMAGRELPMVFFGEHSERSYGIDIAVKSAAEFQVFRAMADRRELVLYRDPKGRRDYCRINGVSDKDIAFQKGVSVNVQLSAADFGERVEIE